MHVRAGAEIREVHEKVRTLARRSCMQVMGISEDNVKARLHRARLQLQAVLDKEAA